MIEGKSVENNEGEADIRLDIEIDAVALVDWIGEIETEGDDSGNP